MGEFIRFVNRNKRILIFLGLQYLCFYLIFNYNAHHKGVYLTTTSTLGGSLNERMSSVTHYFSLSEENEHLLERIAELEAERPEAFRLIDNNFAVINDTMFRRNYTYQYAHIIQSTIGLNNNYLTLDRGRYQDVTEEMVVRGNEGLVGLVDRVTENYALVMPIINPAFKASAFVPRTGNFGLLTWDGIDHRIAQIGDIPAESEVKIGDAVVTRGSGSLFPRGIMIGTIEELKQEPGASFYEIDVRLSTDFSRLNNVYLIGNTFKQELDSLKNLQTIDE